MNREWIRMMWSAETRPHKGAAREEERSEDQVRCDRFAHRPSLALAGLFLLFFSGCWGSSTNTNSTTVGGKESGKTLETENASAVPVTPLLDGWEQPAVAIVLSGEQFGHLEPCGCSEHQTGGIARRDDMIRQMKDRGWSVTSLDLGSTVRRSRDQSRIKHEVLLQALHDMHCEALGAGPEELRFGADFLVSRYSPSPDQPSLVSANVVLYDVPDLGTPQRFKIIEVNGVRIGVTSVVGNTVRNEVFPQGANTDVSFQTPEAALPPVLESLKAEQPDLLVLLSQSSVEESERLAKAFPDFDLVLSADGFEDPSGRPQQVGKTMLVTVGQKGKYAGVVGFYPNSDEQRLRFELVSLDRRFENSARMQEYMRYYQDQLKNYQGVGIVHTEEPVPHPSGATFVGVDKCAQCHTKAYAVWKDSKHAHAYESLERGREGQGKSWVSRIHDPECLNCHTTGWHPQDVFRYEGGFVDGKTHVDAKGHPLLAGNQCENCHGPGSQHVELEELWKSSRDQVDRDQLLEQRRAMHLTVEIAKESVCRNCHDGDNSPNFKFDEYWKKVVHRGKD